MGGFSLHAWNGSDFMKVCLMELCCHKVYLHHLCSPLCRVYLKYLLILLNTDSALVRGAYTVYDI